MSGVNNIDTIFNNLLTAGILGFIGYLIWNKAKGKTVNMNFDLGKYTKYHRK